MAARDQQIRVEDPRLLKGMGHFVDDLKKEKQAYMGIVRSPLAHARIKKIDFSDLTSDPNFIASLTGEDLLKEGVSPITQNQWPPQKRAARYHLAVGKVRFVGEAVAAILSRDKYALEDLIERVSVDYESLPVVTTVEESKSAKVLVFDEWENNITQQDETKWGDADKAISSAPYAINARESIERQAAAPIEPRAVFVEYNSKEDVFEVRGTVQSAHGLRHLLSSELNMPLERFHVTVEDVGGGFGSKGAQSYPEALLACLFAKKTGLPIKWTASRSEEFLEAASGRDEYLDITLACTKEGKLIALKGHLETNAGVSGTQSHMSMLTIWTMIGLYGIRNVDLKMEAYVTNKMPLGPVRGAGVPEGCYFIERAMDSLARKAGVDPLEFRRRNLSKGASKNITPLIDGLIETARYQELVNWRNAINSKRSRAGSTQIVAGIGIAAHGGGSDEEDSAQDWSNQSDSDKGSDDSNWNSEEDESESESEGGVAGFMSETARVTIDRLGNVTVFTGSSPHGQGHETTFAQLASEELGIPIDSIAIRWGDTRLIPVATGTFGSRSAAAGGSAVVDASRKLKSLLLARAAKVLGRAEDSLLISGGNIVSAKDPSVSLVSISELLGRLDLDELSTDSTFTLKELSHSNGIHLCALTVDAQGQKVSIARYIAVEDPGRVINRAIIEGQLQGGVVHAIGGALLERLVHDSEGNLLSSTFLDYDIPAAQESPDIEVHLMGFPPRGVLDGAKGIGESGTIAGYAAVVNAVNDALSQISEAQELSSAPVTQEKLYRAIYS